MIDLRQTLNELGGMVWAQTLGVSLQPAQIDLPLDDPGTIEGHVHISGTWTGLVILRCSAAAARQATQKMFNLRDEPPVAQDVRDTIGELTNILGGNIKALVSTGGCSLSLPVVLEGESYTVTVPGARVLARQAFEDGGEPVVVTVLETDPPARLCGVSRAHAAHTP